MSSIVYAQNKTADDFNLSKTRLAVQGYDVVSYFNDEPKEGDKAIQSTVEGVHYYFSSQKNKAFYTSFDRELLYCLDHAIHHQALIKIGLKELQIADLVGDDFGVAYSTLRYRASLDAN